MNSRAGRAGLLFLSLVVVSAGMAFAGTTPVSQTDGPHGGFFCAVQECGIGLVEAKIKDRMLHLWFFTGPENSPKPLAIPQQKLFLLTSPENAGPRTTSAELMRSIKEIQMAPETDQEGLLPGKGSFHFSGALNTQKVNAVGWAWVANQLRPFRIMIPGGLHVNCSSSGNKSSGGSGGTGGSGSSASGGSVGSSSSGSGGVTSGS